MRRLLTVTALLAAVIPATADARAFSYGVSSAEVTNSSALLWARSLKSGKVHLVLALDKNFTRKRITETVFARKSNDLTVQAHVAGLAASTR
jgi:phosphodiesterase/alkaline phosphatase D-like protein